MIGIGFNLKAQLAASVSDLAGQYAIIVRGGAYYIVPLAALIA